MPRTPPAGAFCGVVFRETGSKPAFQLGEGGVAGGWHRCY